MQGAGLLVDQQGDGHAPGPLARDAPVRAVAHHGLDAGAAPVRGPGDALDLAQGGVPQALPLHADEPLGGGAEDDGGLVAPAVGIAVGEACRLDQGAPGLEGVHDLLVGAEDMLAGEEGGVGQEAAVAAHGVLHPQAVAVADQIIIQAMAGGGVDGAGAGLQGDMLPEDDGHLAVIEGVLELQPLEGVAPAIGDDPVAVDAPAVQVVAHQTLGEDEALAARVALGLDEDVFQLGVEGHGLVGGQGPGGGGPDDHGQGAVAAPVGHRVTAGEEGLLVQDREADVDGDGLLVGVFHLGLRESGTAVDAPVHRLVAFLDMAVGQDHPQGADDVGLEVEVHGQVGVLPVAKDPQALEVAALAIHLARGIVAAGAPELGGADLGAGLAFLLFHLELDGQAMAVPARHVGGVQAVQGAGLDDDVLQHLVDGVTDMDVAVGVGRAVVEDELLGPRPGGANLAVEVHGLPVGEQLRFPLGEVCLHGKTGVGEVEGGLVIAHGAGS